MRKKAARSADPAGKCRPGETITYLWHADKEYKTCLLDSFGDMRNHRYHGLFGAIIIEPPGAKYYRAIVPVEEGMAS